MHCGGNRIWLNVGDDARTALAEQKKLANRLATKVALMPESISNQLSTFLLLDRSRF